MVTREQLEQFKKICTNVEAVKKADFLFKALINPNTPLWLHATIISGLVYLINPFDLIPDFTPVFGYLDDIATVTTIIGLVVKTYKDIDIQD